MKERYFFSSALIGKESIEDAAQSNFHHPCPCSCLHLPLSGQRYTPSAMNANGCMDTAQKVAFVAQLSLLGLIFHHTSRTQLAWVSEGFRGGKNSGVGSARQPSLTQSKEVDLAAISYVQRAPPSHHPACLGPLCRDSKSVLQVLLREKLSVACIKCIAEK